MTIAVHIELTDSRNDTSSNFNYNCFTNLAGRFPEHHFIFIFDKPFDTSSISEKNITPVLTGPQIRNRLLQHYFYNFKIPRLLNKYNADIFVSTGVCSLRTHVIQYLLIDDLSFLTKKNRFSKTESAYLKRYTAYFVRKAALIGVLNASYKKTIQKAYNEDEDKINVLKQGVDPVFKPGGYEAVLNTRTAFTESKEYFLFFSSPASAANIIPMLKAFSVFKKWQRSGMQLLVLSSPGSGEASIPGLSSYKYRSDIKIISAENKDVQASLVAAAYAAIHLPDINQPGPEGLMAIAAEVPLITTNSELQRSLYGEHVLYCDIDEKEISKNLQLLYKDEQSRNELISHAKKIAEEHSWSNASMLLWETMQSYSAATPTFAKK